MSGPYFCASCGCFHQAVHEALNSQPAVVNGQAGTLRVLPWSGVVIERIDMATFLLRVPQAAAEPFASSTPPAGVSFVLGTAAADELTVGPGGLAFGLAGDDRINVQGSGSTAVGGEGDDLLVQTSEGSNVYLGGPGRDVINAGYGGFGAWKGSNTIDGGTGADVLMGGQGPDVYIIRDRMQSYRDASLDNTVYVLADGWVPSTAYGGGFARIVLVGDVQLASDPALALVGNTAVAGYAQQPQGYRLTYTFVDSIAPEDPLHFSFFVYGTPQGESPTFTPASTVFKAAVREAMAAWSAVADVTFIEVANASQADLVIARPNMGGHVAAYTGMGVDPSDTWPTAFAVGTHLRDPDFERGQFGFKTILHELGHVLGLRHPWEQYHQLPGELSHTAYTVMAYGEQTPGNYPQSPRPLDIAAAQYLLGAPRSTSGDDIIRVDPRDTFLAVVGDRGGTDLLDMSDHTAAITLDLRPGSMGRMGGGQNNLHIAHGTVIERVKTGSGDDRITGWIGPETLEGGAGRDTLIGGPGDDLLAGGIGLDTVVYSGLRAQYTITWQPDTMSFRVVSGSEGSDTLTGIDRLRFADAELTASALREGANSAPTLSGTAALSTAALDQPFTVTWAMLAGALQEGDADGDAVSFLVSSVQEGTLTKGGSPVVPGVTVVSDGEALVWTPPPKALGMQPAFSVQGTDLTAPSIQSALVSVLVTHPPVVTGPLVTRNANLGSPLQFSLPPDAFRDADTAVLTYSASLADGTPLPAWLSFNASTLSFSGTPTSGDLGTLSVKVTASDGSLSASGVFVLVVTKSNQAPVGADLDAATNEDTPLSRYLNWARDPDGDPVTYAKASDPAHGTVSVGPSDRFTYVPHPDFFGTDSFTHTVTDDKGAFNTYTVKLTVNAVNDAPVATGGSLSTAEDTQAAGTLTATDVDNASLTYAVVSQPANGSVVLGANGAYIYTPAANFNGSDSFTFKANDGSADSNTATVTITVAAVNDAPAVAAPLPDRSVTLGSSLNFSFGASAFTDVETANLTYTATRADGSALPAWLSFNAGTRTFSGTPASGDLGTLSVKVTASDGSLSASDVFDVVVSQRPNTAPVAANATGSTSEDTVLTASLPAAADGESDQVTYAKATNPSHGTATVTAGGSYTYTPTANYNGPDSFTYTVSDGQGGSNTYTVNLTVTAVNDVPVAAAGSLSAVEDTKATGTLTATDVDNASLGFALVSQPANGNVVLGANGAYTYTPAANFNGSDSFTFKANDGSADSNTATVTITVSAVNDAPVLTTPLPDRSVTLGSSLNFSFAASAFTDVETANLTYTATRADGTALPTWLSFNAGTRTFSGTPASGDLGTLSVKVTVSDGSLSASDVFDVTVAEVQRPVSGVVQDGYVAGASIFVDRNGNGLPDAGEDTGLRTDSSGNFTGTISGTGNLIAVGGTNIDTGLRNTLTLTAPQGATVISPVTTLVQTLVSTQALTPTQAQQKVAQAFGIDSATDLLRFDPLASGGSATSSAALTVQKANAQVALTAGLVENTSGVISGLAQVVAQASAPVDLSKAATLAQVTSGLNVSTALQTTITQGNAQVQTSTSLSSVAQVQKTTVNAALPPNTDWTAPTVSSFSPATGATGVAVSSNLALTFSEPVQRGSGTLTLRRADGTVVEQFDAANSNRLTFQSNSLVLDPSADLAAATGYYLEMAPGSVKDSAGNLFVGSSSYGFSTQSRTGDVIAPTATMWGPADGAKAVPVGANLSITYNELIQRGSGTITLKTADGKAVETFTSANSTVSGSTLTLNPTADLSVFTKYVVELGAGAVKDLAGNANVADSRYDFQTATQDSLYHFFVVAFAAAPGATYMGQLAEAVNFGLPLKQIVEIFTTKPQFTGVYPTTMSNRELATTLVNNIVKTSASPSARSEAINDIETVLSPAVGWSRGKMLYTVFGNLASKPLTDPVWGGTAKQFQNQLAVARYFTEEMGVATENLATLRGVIANVTPDTDVSTTEKIVQIIGTVPPPGG